MCSRVIDAFTCCRRNHSPSGTEDGATGDSELASPSMSCHTELLELIDICIDPNRSLLNNDVLIKTCDKWRHEELALQTCPEPNEKPVADDRSPSITGKSRLISAEGARRVLALDTSTPSSFVNLQIRVENDFTVIDNDATLTNDIHQIFHAGSDAPKRAPTPCDVVEVANDNAGEIENTVTYENAAVEVSEDTFEDGSKWPATHEASQDSEGKQTTPSRHKDKDTLSSVLKEVHCRLDGNRISVPTNAAIKHKRPPKNRPIPQGKEKRRGTPNKHLEQDKQNDWFDAYKHYLDKDNSDQAEHDEVDQGLEKYDTGTAIDVCPVVVTKPPTQTPDNRHLFRGQMEEYRKDDNNDDGRHPSSDKKRMRKARQHGGKSTGGGGGGDADLFY